MSCTTLLVLLLAALPTTSGAFDFPESEQDLTLPAAGGLVGTWRIVRESAQQLELDMMRRTVGDDPPSEAEVGALPPEIRATITLLRERLDADPSSAAMMQAMLEEMEGATLSFDGARIRIGMSAAAFHGPYTVTPSPDGNLRIQFTVAELAPQTLNVRFDGPDALLVRSDGVSKPQRYVREQ